MCARTAQPCLTPKRSSTHLGARRSPACTGRTPQLRPAERVALYPLSPPHRTALRAPQLRIPSTRAPHTAPRASAPLTAPRAPQLPCVARRRPRAVVRRRRRLGRGELTLTLGLAPACTFTLALTLSRTRTAMGPCARRRLEPGSHPRRAQRLTRARTRPLSPSRSRARSLTLTRFEDDEDEIPGRSGTTPP